MPEDVRELGLGCAYVGQYHLDQFRRDLEEIQAAGVARLFLPMTEEDLGLRRPNLAAMAEAARGAGIEPYFFPWGVGGVFSGPSGARFAAHHPEARQIDSAGTPLPAACPNHHLFQHFMEEWVDAAAEAGAQGVLWDEPAWARHAGLPDYRGMNTGRLWTCLCAECRKRYQQIYGEEPPLEPHEEFNEFRARSLAAFVRALGERAEKRGMDGIVRISPFGALDTWRILAGAPWTRAVSASAFFATRHTLNATAEERLGEFLRRAEAACGLLRRITEGRDTAAFVWTRCYQIPQKDEPLIEATLDILRGQGAGDFAIWAFDGAAAVGALACERPREAWRAAVKAVGRK